MPFGDWFSDWFGDWFGSREVSALSGSASLSVSATGKLDASGIRATGGNDQSSRARAHEARLREMLRIRRAEEEEVIMAVVQFVIAGGE